MQSSSCFQRPFRRYWWYTGVLDQSVFLRSLSNVLKCEPLIKIFLRSLISGIFLPRALSLIFQLMSLWRSLWEYLLISSNLKVYLRPFSMSPPADMDLLYESLERTLPWLTFFFVVFFFYIIGSNYLVVCLCFFLRLWENISNSCLWSLAYPSGNNNALFRILAGSLRRCKCFLSRLSLWLRFPTFLLATRLISLWALDRTESPSLAFSIYSVDLTRPWVFLLYEMDLEWL